MAAQPLPTGLSQTEDDMRFFRVVYFDTATGDLDTQHDVRSRHGSGDGVSTTVLGRPGRAQVRPSGVCRGEAFKANEDRAAR